jgi:hypothetical protein
MLVILRAERSAVVHTEKLQSNEFAHLATQPLPVEATRSEQANERRAGCQVGGLTKLVGERDGGRGAIWGTASRAGRHVAQHWAHLHFAVIDSRTNCSDAIVNG